ncbi:MAG TPA: single-stranded DNA-binding protein [Microbacteriaceae bacterium]|nr:single-stranded DNA-binding protein [Microbacteriaceae bacterium]
MKQTIFVVGIVATDPTEINNDGKAYVCKFRLASTERRYDKETKTWVDKSTNWFNVNIFRNLGKNAKNSISKGDRVLIYGRLRINNWDNGSKSGTSVDIDADAIGHDLKWGTSHFTKNKISSDAGEEDRELLAPDEAQTHGDWHAHLSSGQDLSPGQEFVDADQAVTPF